AAAAATTSSGLTTTAVGRDGRVAEERPVGGWEKDKAFRVAWRRLLPARPAAAVGTTPPSLSSRVACSTTARSCSQRVPAAAAGGQKAEARGSCFRSNSRKGEGVMRSRQQALALRDR
ncbi:unnamed protein product, partial [Ectocarpus fasciculatus]